MKKKENGRIVAPEIDSFKFSVNLKGIKKSHNYVFSGWRRF